LLQEVVRSGTGAGVRDYGFTLPAAGKTGTSRDGWFAGFTSRLLCVVWVGFDDNRDLNLEGAHSALPIWAEFMKRASQFPEYRDARPFQPPPGVVSVRLCSETGQLAGDYCPETHREVFIDGTQPACNASCTLSILSGLARACWTLWKPLPPRPAVRLTRVTNEACPSPSSAPAASSATSGFLLSPPARRDLTRTQRISSRNPLMESPYEPGSEEDQPEI